MPTRLQSSLKKEFPPIVKWLGYTYVLAQVSDTLIIHIIKTSIGIRILKG